MTSMSSTLFDTEREFFDHGKEIAKELDANHGYLNKQWTWPKSESTVGLVAKEEPAVVEPETYTLVDSGRTINVVKEHPHADPEPINTVRKVEQVVIPDLSISADEPAPNAGFGTEFPDNPNKGDMFLRVDYLPSKLYKWNTQKWIEISKEQTDQYAYDHEYIKHLIDKLDSGEYDVELLSDVEKDQIQRYLNDNSSRQ